MDALLQERWKNAESPFSGDCLHLDDEVPIASLRTFLSSIVERLQQTHGAAKLFHFDDWHAHDGFVTQRSSVDWSELILHVSDEKRLYANRQGDTYVSRAIYPEDFAFLLRFCVLDADENIAYPGIWGTCDLCAPSDLLKVVVASAPDTVAPQIRVSNAKPYFDRIYAG